MDISSEIFGYAKTAISHADALLTTLVIFALVIVYLIYFGSSAIRTKLNHETRRRDKLRALNTRVDKTFASLKAFYETKSDIRFPDQHRFIEKVAQLQLGMAQLESRLQHHDIAEKQKRFPEFFTGEVTKIQNYLRLFQYRNQRLTSPLDVPKRHLFNELDLDDIEDLSQFDLKGAQGLYNDTAAVIAALEADNLIDAREILKRRIRELAPNVDKIDAPDVSLSKEAEALLDSLRKENINSVGALKAGLTDAANQVEELDDQLNKIVQIPVLGISVSYNILVWVVPLFFWVGYIFIWASLYHAHQLIAGLPQPDSYQQLLTIYPWTLVKPAGQGMSPYYALLFCVLAFPAIVAMLTLIESTNSRDSHSEKSSNQGELTFGEINLRFFGLVLCLGCLWFVIKITGILALN